MLLDFFLLLDLSNVINGVIEEYCDVWSRTVFQVQTLLPGPKYNPQMDVRILNGFFEYFLHTDGVFSKIPT